MVQQITKGIKISVKTTYNGTSYRGYNQFHAFSYFVSIENTTDETVQLLERFWEIHDTLNGVEFVEGEGVIGQTPVIGPDEKYNYRSNCFLHGHVGAMKGKYKMVNTETLEKFFVNIPTFQLITTPSLS